MRLTPTESSTLRSLRNKEAVYIDGRWRLKGAPAPRVNMFALAVLFEAKLVALRTPQVAVLTAAGLAWVKRREPKHVPYQCSSPLRPIARRA